MPLPSMPRQKHGGESLAEVFLILGQGGSYTKVFSSTHITRWLKPRALFGSRFETRALAAPQQTPGEHEAAGPRWTQPLSLAYRNGDTHDYFEAYERSYIGRGIARHRCDDGL